jgi:hypothetical protein
MLLVACNITGGTVIDPNDSCSSLEGGIKDDCYLQQNKCSKISSPTTRNTCVAELARLKDDLTICNLIQSGKSKGFCQEQIIVARGDHLLCYDIEDEYWQDNCHYHLGVDQENRNFCGLINDPKQRWDCLLEVAHLTNDVTICNSIGPEGRGSCIRTIAVQLANPKICGRLNHPVNQDACRFKVAKTSVNESICDLIVTEAIKRDCHQRFEEGLVT